MLLRKERISRYFPPPEPLFTYLKDRRRYLHWNCPHWFPLMFLRVSKNSPSLKEDEYCPNWIILKSAISDSYSWWSSNTLRMFGNHQASEQACSWDRGCVQSGLSWLYHNCSGSIARYFYLKSSPIPNNQISGALNRQTLFSKTRAPLISNTFAVVNVFGRARVTFEILRKPHHVPGFCQLYALLLVYSEMLIENYWSWDWERLGTG